MKHSQPQVLIVDDSEDDALLLTAQLSGLNFAVHYCESSQEALDQLAEHSFDVMITDLRMPQLSGDRLIERAQQMPHNQYLRSILLSGYAHSEVLIEVLRSGRIFRYLDKRYALLDPQGQAELCAATTRAVESSRLERERAQLTERLGSQLKALQAQQHLIHLLAKLTQPAQILAVITESLSEHLSSQAVLALVDLQPDHHNEGHLHLAQSVHAADETAQARLWAEAYAEYQGLTDRDLQGTVRQHLSAEAEGEPHKPQAPPISGGAAPIEQAHTLPLFIRKDLRGLLQVFRPKGRPLAPDEWALFRIWRDLLQEALDRLYSRMLDEHTRLQLMLDHMQEGVVLTDEQGLVRLSNPVARRILGLSPSGLHDFTQVLEALKLPSLEVMRQLSLNADLPQWREIQQGAESYHVRLSILRDHTAKPVGMLTLLRDISEEKRALQQQESFVYLLSHELRSPLTTIRAVLDLLLKSLLGPVSVDQQRHIEMAKDSTTKLNLTIDELLDLAKFKGGKMPIERQPVQLDQLVLQAATKFEALALSQKVHLKIDAFTQDLHILGDPLRLTQVLNNLISNALKFSPPEHTVTISCWAALSAPELSLCSVHNRGGEIGAAHLERIFEAFEQLREGSQGGRGGTGLGLSISQRIVQAHGGEIWAESGQGRGTAFVFALPNQQPEGETLPHNLKAQGAHILLVGADPRELFALKARLLSMGYRVRLIPLTEDRPLPQRAAEDVQLLLWLDLEEDSAQAQQVGEWAQRHQLPSLALVPMGSGHVVAFDAALELPADVGTLSNMLHVLVNQRQHLRRLRVLCIGDDPHALCARLEALGYLAYSAPNAAQGLRRLERLAPDLVVVSAAPNQAGPLYQHLSQPRAVPSLWLHSEGEADEAQPSRIRWLQEPAPIEAIVQQVRHIFGELRQRTAPLLVLPGLRALEHEIRRRQSAQLGFSYLAIDLKGLERAVQQHGFIWGQGALGQLAELIQEALRQCVAEEIFFGHLQGDSFAILLPLRREEPLRAQIFQRFEQQQIRWRALLKQPLQLQLCITVLHCEPESKGSYAEIQAQMNRLRATAMICSVPQGGNGV